VFYVLQTFGLKQVTLIVVMDPVSASKAIVIYVSWMP